MFSGVSEGDLIRVLVQTASTSRYVTLQVDALVASNTTTNTQAAIVFTAPSRYLANQIGSAVAAESDLITVGSDKYFAAFVLPAVIEEGALKLILQLYPQYRG